MFKVLVEGCKPERGSKFSACVDLFASEDVTIYPGDTVMIGLGVSIAIDFNAIHHDYNSMTSTMKDSYKRWFMSTHYLQLMLRSSLGKKGLILPNGVGIIDMDYRDEIKLLVHNPIYDVHFNDQRFVGVNDEYTYEIKKGDKIAQVTLLEHKAHLFGIETDAERDGGFGSTDKDHYDLKKEDEQDGRNL